MSLGKKITQLRKTHGCTLRRVSEGTGLSTSFLSQLERGKVNISVANLKKIALFFGVSMVHFFEDDVDPSEGCIIRAIERKALAFTQPEIQIESILPQGSSKLEAFLVKASPGAVDNTQYPHHGEEFSLLLEGHINYLLDDEEHILKAGDTIFHKSNIPHQWRNVGQGEAIVLTVCTPPGF